MELLDLETRRLRNEQTKAGLTKYANLSKDFNEVIINEDKNNLLFEEFKKLKEKILMNKNLKIIKKKKKEKLD